jgi:hypothetical protein
VIEDGSEVTNWEAKHEFVQFNDLQTDITAENELGN